METTLQRYIKELEAISNKYSEEQTINDMAIMQGTSEETEENRLLLDSLIELDEVINNIKRKIK